MLSSLFWWALLIPGQNIALASSEQNLGDLIDGCNRQVTRMQVGGSVCPLMKSARPRPRPGALPQGAAESSESPGPAEEVPFFESLDRTTVKDFKGRDLPISVVPEDRVGELRQEMDHAVRKRLPQGLKIFDAAACAQRSHVVGHVLGELGIETVKLIVKPDKGFLGFGGGAIAADEKTRTNDGQSAVWREVHIVNMIYVKKKTGEIEPYVIDPFMESTPVPQTAWESRLSGVKTREIASRYVVDDRRRFVGYEGTEYDERRLQEAYGVLKGSIQLGN